MASGVAPGELKDQKELLLKLVKITKIDLNYLYQTKSSSTFSPWEGT